jgi:serine/threonine-protein kinase
MTSDRFAVTPDEDEFAPRPLEQAIEPGTLIGAFRVQRVADRGARATSYEAVRPADRVRVTLRVYSAELCEAHNRVDRFLAMQRNLSSFPLTNVPRVLEVGRVPDGRAWLAIDQLRGAALPDRLRASALPRPEADHLLRELVRGLVAAHAHRLAHSDLRLEDLYVCEEPGRLPTLRILDVGVGELLGREAAAIDHAAAADIRALGRIAVRLWSGRELDESRDLVPKQAGARRFEGMSASEERLVLAMLSPDPSLRPSAGEVARRLARREHEDARETPARGTRALDSVEIVIEQSAEATTTPVAVGSPSEDPPAELEIPHAPSARALGPIAIGAVVLAVVALLAMRALRPRAAPAPADRPVAAAPVAAAPVATQPHPPAEAPAPTPSRAAAGVLVLELGDAHATVLVDGVAQKTSGRELVIEGSGTHRVHVQARGYIPFDRTLSVGDGERVRVPVALGRERARKDLNYLVDPFK